MQAANLDTNLSPKVDALETAINTAYLEQHEGYRRVVIGRDPRTSGEMVRQAVEFDPEEKDYWILLSRIQRKNPKWVRHASETLRRAIKNIPASIELLWELSEACKTERNEPERIKAGPIAAHAEPFSGPDEATRDKKRKNFLALVLCLMVGTAALPHILMRFFTVPTAQEARKSVIWAMGIIGGFYVLTLFLGMGAAIHVGAGDISLIDKGGNMAAPLLSELLGGTPLLGFIAAVAFATILAVVSGLALAGASAISHDLYARVLKKGKASEASEMKVSKIATICLGVVAIALGILFEQQNVAFMVGVAFGIAAAANFPVLILSMYWKGLTTRGAVAGGVTGLVSAVTLVFLSKSVWVNVLGNKAPLFPWDQPALFAMPAAFLAAFVFSKLDATARARAEQEAFEDQYVRAQTGYGAAAAAKH